MAGGAKLVGQVVAVGLVAALLGLLVWKVARGDDGGAAGRAGAGEEPGRAGLHPAEARQGRRVGVLVVAG